MKKYERNMEKSFNSGGRKEGLGRARPGAGEAGVVFTILSFSLAANSYRRFTKFLYTQDNFL